MFWRRFRLFKVFGIEIKADISWFFLAAIIIGSLAAGTFPFYYPEMSVGAYVAMGFLGAIGLFASIIAHELSHSLVGRYYKVPVHEITLFLFGGVAHMDEEPRSPKAEFIIALAGPVMSIAIGLALLGMHEVGENLLWNRFFLGVILYLGQINLILAAFNLIPAFPLDGGRMLRSVLWGIKKDLRWATQIASVGGRIFGYFLIFSGVLQFLFMGAIGGLWFVFLGILLVGIAKASYQQLLVKQSLQGRTVARVMNEHPNVVSPDTPTDQMVRNFLYDGDVADIPVVESGQLRGCVPLEKINSLSENEWRNHKADEFLESCPADVVKQPNLELDEAVKKMGKSGKNYLYVVEHGKLLGTISMAAINRYLILRLKKFNEDPSRAVIAGQS